MRRALILLTFFLALIPVFLRARERPVFITGYTYVQELALTTQQGFLYHALLLTLFLVLILFCIKKYEFPTESLFLLIATPALITALVLPSRALAIGVLALLALLFARNTYVLALTTIAAAVLTPQALVLAPLALFILVLKKQRVLTACTVALLATLTYLHGIPALSGIGFAELGTLGGQSLFILLLAITGIVLSWSKKTYPYLLSALYTLAAGFFFSDLRFAAVIAATVTVGYAIKALRERDWRLESVRNVSILLVVCGLLFAATVTINEATQAPPTPETQHLIHFLTHTEEPVFALPEHHEILHWQAIPIAYTDYETVLISRNIDVTGPNLPPLIILNAADEADNLRFLIDVTDRFSVVYTNEEWTVWEVR